MLPKKILDVEYAVEAGDNLSVGAGIDFFDAKMETGVENNPGLDQEVESRTKGFGMDLAVKVSELAFLDYLKAGPSANESRC